MSRDGNLQASGFLVEGVEYPVRKGIPLGRGVEFQPPVAFIQHALSEFRGRLGVPGVGRGDGEELARALGDELGQIITVLIHREEAGLIDSAVH